MDIQVRLRDELVNAFADAVSAAAMIAYATSRNERDNHKDSLSKARTRFMDLLQKVPEMCDGPL